MNSDYIRMIEDQKIIDEYQEQHSQILELIEKLGSHPAFSLPPVSEFIKQLKEILNAS